jgi:hypothetical protein
MIYELFLEGQLADIRQDLGMQLSYNIDDINKYGSRDTSFSKTIVLPGTARNNKLFGFVGELGSNNPYAAGSPNINVNFNVAQTTKAELRANGLLLLKGIFRLTGMVHDKGHIEYEGNLFGELGGFIAAIGRGKLEELDFGDYDHTYTRDNIVNSWNTINGSGYYYGLIDYGTYSPSGARAKIDYDYRTFRPALYVREYMDKIFSRSGYTFESSFFDSAFFKKLIIPNNSKELRTLNNRTLEIEGSTVSPLGNESDFLYYNIYNFLGDFTTSDGFTFTYNGASAFKPILNINISGTQPNSNWKLISGASTVTLGIKILLRVNNGGVITKYGLNGNNDLTSYDFTITPVNGTYSIPAYNVSNFYIDTQIANGTQISIEVHVSRGGVPNISAKSKLDIFSQIPVSTQAVLNDQIFINDSLPKNILQKDFFIWIIKMFNLYITEDKVREKHLLIEPYVDYYDLSESIDWTYKVARDKPFNIKPMGMLTSRFYEYKYKDDSDFYNDNYKKKFNLPYGSNLQDTFFQFAKEKQTIDIGFSPSVLVGYLGRDKIVSALYKKSSGNSLQQEERMDSNIRILMAKKITGVTSWYIVNTGASQNSTPQQLGAALTAYGYAGHFDDPVNPTKDINFGAASEIYFDPNTYPTNNLFNDYWSAYIAEIADKDSKILSCHVYLNDLDIAQLDFSKPVFIDGVLWRINKVMDYDSTSGELTKVELLKVINNG